MHLFVDISSHGFGHLAITAPVLNALAEATPNFRLTIRSALPAAKLQQRIKTPYTLIPTATDFGYVMINATHIDLDASAAAYRQAHENWSARVADEARFLASLKPDLILTNVSYLPLAGAAVAGIPALSLCSLNWADLFEHYFRKQAWAKNIHAEMLSAYRSAQAFLRVTPGMAMDALGNVQPVGPIAAFGWRHDLGPERRQSHPDCHGRHRPSPAGRKLGRACPACAGCCPPPGTASTPTPSPASPSA